MKNKYLKIILLLALLVLGGLFYYGYNYYPAIPYSFVYPETSATQFLKNNIGHYRLTSYKESLENSSSTTLPSESTIWNLDDTRGYEITKTETYQALEEHFRFFNHKIFNILGVKYLVQGKSDLENEKLASIKSFPLVYEDDSIYIYENKEVMPRAFLVFDIKPVANHEQALDVFLDDSFKAEMTALVETENSDSLTNFRNYPAAPYQSVEIVDYSPRKIEIATDSEKDGYLVLTDTYYPGWQAHLDGQEIEIYPTNIAFRGIFVPSGKHQITFEYHPKSFLHSVYINIFALLKEVPFPFRQSAAIYQSIYPQAKIHQLIRLPENNEVYLIEQGLKRLISAQEIFEKMYTWEMVEMINKTDFEKYPEGTEIKGALWTDKQTLQPLEELKINFWLPETDSVKLKVKDSSGRIYASNEYIQPIKTGQLAIKVGKELGQHTIVLEAGQGKIAPEVNFQVEAETTIHTGLADLDSFYPQVKAWMAEDISYCRGAKGYRSPDTWPIWVRDHTHQSKGFRYWEKDMTGIIDWFFKNQYPDGSFYDFCPGGRLEVEADVEYLMVLATYQVWQATGDDQWMFSRLGQLERGLNYSMVHPYRWDSQRELVKRAFTPDTWDFQWNDGSAEINENTTFGVLSGDNSGMYQAAQLLGKMFGLKGDKQKEQYWQKVSIGFKDRGNQYLWNRTNGHYKGFLHIDPPSPPTGKNSDNILGLSNAYNLNRGDFVSHIRAVEVIQAYQQRIKTTRWKNERVFQEWFSINPNYGDNKWGTVAADKSGEYVNGGIMPLVGGELSRAAFEHGFESYGLQELSEYIDLTQSHGNKAYLWYWPDGQPGVTSQETLSTDGWGSSAFLNAFIEGLIGVVDLDKLYQEVKISPRWPITGTNNAEVVITYGASDGYFAYQWHLFPGKKQIEIVYTGSGQQANFHTLLPENSRAISLTIDEQKSNFRNNRVEKSNYLDFDSGISGTHRAVIIYE